jgi:hypothetical protein
MIFWHLYNLGVKNGVKRGIKNGIFGYCLQVMILWCIFAKDMSKIYDQKKGEGLSDLLGQLKLRSDV